jgi:hypothetical protein
MVTLVECQDEFHVEKGKYSSYKSRDQATVTLILDCSLNQFSNGSEFGNLTLPPAEKNALFCWG